MQTVRKRKLIMLIFFMTMLTIITGLVLYALRQNISLFYSPTQISLQQAPLQQLVRVGGMVKVGSLKRKPNSLEVQFDITDFENTITVYYKGILPDLFREGQGIVASGYLKNHQTFKASQILAKHDENYMPPEVRSTLQKPNAGGVT